MINAGEHGYFFALWRGKSGDYTEYGLSNIAYGRSDKRDSKSLWKRYKKLANDYSPYVLKEGNFPKIVRFEDLNNPLSIEAVTEEYLIKTFGQDSKFVQAEIQTVKESFAHNHKLKQVIPWAYSSGGIDFPEIWDSHIRYRRSPSKSNFVSRRIDK